MIVITRHIIQGDGDADGDDEDEEDEEEEEWIHMDDRYYYLNNVMRFLSVTHSIVALCMLLAYYHLKVSDLLHVGMILYFHLVS